MTIQECIDFADMVSPNGVATAVKRRWLWELEGQVQVELLGVRPGALEEPPGVEGDDEELCVPYPYDRMYWLYLVSMMEYMRGNAERYEPAAALFNAAYLAYGKWQKREGA